MTDKEMKNMLIQWLFETQAMRVAPEHEPFWYTSGTIGPYYINTHFLYGSETEANALLHEIDLTLDQPDQLIQILTDKTEQEYQTNPLYQAVMDRIIQIAGSIPCDFISGGERRDFFFSVCAASQLGKPHVSIFKNQSTWISSNGQHPQSLSRDALAGQKALHISDLVTEASSYMRAWIPAIRHLGASMPATLSIVDRGQNGRDRLAAEQVQLTALLTIQDDLFAAALKMGLIDQGQYQQLIHFIQDPDQYQKEFIKNHPDFIDQQIQSGGRNKERALLYLEMHHGSTH